MGANLWPVDAVSGAPEYAGRQLRTASVAPALAIGSAARPLGAKSGIRPGTPSSIVAATSTTWTVHSFGGVLDGEAAAAAGPYGYSFDSDQTGSVTAAEGSSRIDRLDVQVSDPAESDGSSVPLIAVVYTKGTAGAGAAPTAPARSHRLALLNVPATGGGSPTVTWAPDWSSAAGAPWVFNTKVERDAYVTGITAVNVPPRQQARVIGDTTAVNNGDTIWDAGSSSWFSVTPAAMRFLGTLSAAQSANANSAYVVQEDTVSGWNATNRNWVCPADGFYQVTAAARQSTGTATALQLFINSTRVYITPNSNNNAFGGPTLHFGRTLAAGDTIAIQPSAAYTPQNEATLNNFLQIVRLA